MYMVIRMYFFNNSRVITRGRGPIPTVPPLLFIKFLVWDFLNYEIFMNATQIVNYAVIKSRLVPGTFFLRCTYDEIFFIVLEKCMLVK